MESCFPPLAALSLRGSLSGKKQKNRHSLGANLMVDKESIGDHYQLASTPTLGSGDSVAARIPQSQSAYGHRQLIGQPSHDYLARLEVLQDLDLYYIRQMASSLKV